MELRMLPTVALFLLCTTLPASAQNITPTADGTGTIVEYNGQTYRISGGTTAAANLFHSFQAFGLSPGEIAEFLAHPGLENILARVTGGDPSVVHGLITVSGGNPHLYLINPAGIIFGSQARLNVPGDFIATTGDRLGFSDGGWLDAVGTVDYSRLTGTPNQLAFLTAQPGAIINQGDLRVGPGQTLGLFGGTVIQSGTVTAPDGQITLAAVPGENRVRISQPGQLLSLELDRGDLWAGFDAVDLPTLLTGIALPPVAPGDLAITGPITAATVHLASSHPIDPTDPTLITTHNGTAQAPTVTRYDTAAAPLSLTFLDATVPDYLSLLYGGRPGTTTVVITPEMAGIREITRVLSHFADWGERVDEVHIVAEGNAGNFWLGSDFVENTTVNQYADLFQQWHRALAPGADLLLYSCFTALGAVGEALINSLADLTGADVAASTNATGSAALGGDWQFERATGNIEGAIAFATPVLTDYQETLALFTVLNGDNAGPNSLRNQINDANALPGADEIRFAPGITLVSLTSNSLNITENLTINGQGNNITIQGNDTFRIFNITNNADVTLNSLTITGGNATAGLGGGILSDGNLTLINSTITDNRTSGADIVRGGGIYTGGALTLINSTVSNNRTLGTNGNGGGIASVGPLLLTNSTVTGNRTAGNFSAGGGIYAQSTVTLNNSTVSNNQTAGDKVAGGGGIRSFGVVNLLNSTVSNNQTLGNQTLVGGFQNNSAGGGIHAPQVNIINSTISGNRTLGLYSNGGGIFVTSGGTIQNSTITNNRVSLSDGGGLVSFGNLTVRNSIIGGNSDQGGEAPDLAGNFTFATLQYNLITSPAGATNLTLGPHNLVDLDPLLGPLGSYGGLTQTHRPLGGSPVINAGSNVFAAGGTDQRGFNRINEGQVDIGAVELTDQELNRIPDATTTLPSFEDVSPQDLTDLSAPQHLGREQTLESETLAALTVDDGFTADYGGFVGNQGMLNPTSLNDTQRSLQAVMQQRGLRPAIIYASFVPPETVPIPVSSPGLTIAPEYTSRFRSRDRSDRDRLELILILPDGQPLRKSIPITRGEIARVVGRLRRDTANHQRINAHRANAQQLYEWLLAPLEPLLQEAGIDSIIYIPDEGLRTVPLAAMHDGQGYVIERYSLTLVPSLALTDLRLPNLQGQQVLAMGASEFVDQEALPNAPLEVEAIAQNLWPGQAYINEAFTFENLVAARAAHPYGIIHLATHGEFRAGRPEDSYIQLSDRRLSLTELASLNWDDPLVELLVLSACQTAINSPEAELGFAGLAVAAGVRSALGSLWSVSDAGTFALMINFYDYLTQVPTKAEALRLAQLALLRGESRVENGRLILANGETIELPTTIDQPDLTFNHPYFWSGFTLIGNPW
ncbi:CHAT domain-containing protein [Spirulina sp. CCNP1310]|uniref:CHAT domain-containing protein n=1 Tax=Spirulina sp. CCNP1310 TaxID=3110249 RepID=UPI002B2056ED|nr:CHAT domain-containing protein [Spirulina sp. CCNP1310]MEA5421501.1 CHAT domain-containing protein [Spirulina sp. CCNP1310]